MRINLWLATGMAAVAVGTAAAAGPGSGQGDGPQGSWSNGGHHSARGSHSRFGIGANGIERRHGAHRRGFGRRDFDHHVVVGIAVPAGEIEPYGDGFFTGGGGQVRLHGGRPYYDYDRSYPYEWNSSAHLREPAWSGEEDRTAAPARCTFENGVRVCRGW